MENEETNEQPVKDNEDTEDMKAVVVMSFMLNQIKANCMTSSTLLCRIE